MTNARSAGDRLLGTVARPHSAGAPAHSHRHAVQFYESETYLITMVTEYIATGLRDGEAAIVVVTGEHRQLLIAGLASHGIEVEATLDAGELAFLDARETLAAFIRDGKPDRAAFQATVGDTVRRLISRNGDCHLRAFGEMVDLLWQDGNPAAALELEELWNELVAELEFSLLCGYAMPSFNEAGHAADLERICATHTSVLPTDRFAGRTDSAQLVEVVLLQQRANALETEIRRREGLERQLREAVATLSDREAELNDVLEHAAEGIHSVGADGMIKWANAAELAMLGYAEAEYVGHHIGEFHVDHAVIDDMLARLARGETLKNVEARLRCKDGSVRDVLVSSNVLFRGDEFAHTRCFTRDVTELKRASEERERLLQRERFARAEAERAKATAEQANRAKSQFLAVMSHELRTPLNAIGGYAELMDMEIHGPISPDQRDALDRIQRSQRHLLGLINQVLNYARLETGHLRYDLSDFALDDVARTVESLAMPAMSAKGLQYCWSTCRPPAIVRADRDKVQQVLLNLLNNATKFTDSGGRITLECHVVEFVVLIRVSDTGIGISADKLDVIFEPFIQVDTNYTRTKDGIGLGLAISRDLARGMGGDLTVESAAGTGSTFTLALPRAG